MLASASPSSAAPSASSSGAYARREPENTVPHRIVREHLETLLATSPLEACMQLFLFGSTDVRLAGAGAPAPLAREKARFRAAGQSPWVAEASVFNVRAGVTVRSGDREGLERLCRYGARPK